MTAVVYGRSGAMIMGSMLARRDWTTVRCSNALMGRFRSATSICTTATSSSPTATILSEWLTGATRRPPRSSAWPSRRSQWPHRVCRTRSTSSSASIASPWPSLSRSARRAGLSDEEHQLIREYCLTVAESVPVCEESGSVVRSERYDIAHWCILRNARQVWCMGPLVAEHTFKDHK